MNNAPTRITHTVMRQYARPIAELLAGHRTLPSVTHLLSHRVEYALRHNPWRLDGVVQAVTGLAQATPGRLEAVAVITLARGDRTHVEAMAFTIEDHDGTRIVALEVTGLRIR